MVTSNSRWEILPASTSLEGVPAFLVVAQDAGERTGLKALPDAERGQLREQVRGDDTAEIEDEALVAHAVQLRSRRPERACLWLSGTVNFELPDAQAFFSALLATGHHP